MSIAARRSHRGDEYQLAVAVHWLTQLLSNPDIVSVQIDAISLPGSPDTVDVDDVVVTYSSGATRHVQAKKNQPNHSRWQISDSDLKEELVKANQQLQKKRNVTIEFCSHTPFGDLGALVESTRDYRTHEVFEAQASAKLRKALTKLQRLLDCSGDAAFDLIRHIEIGSAHSFAGWDAVNLSALQSQVDDPETAFDLLFKMARNNQSGLRGPPGPVTRDQVVQALAARGVALNRNTVPLDLAHIAGRFAVASADLVGWKTTLPNNDWLERPELEALCEQIASEPNSVTLLLGQPGCGKSALLARLAQAHVTLGIPVLAIKADYLAENVVDIAALGDALNLPADPIDCVIELAKATKVLVVIDQLDALADLVVQHSSRLRAPIDLIRGLASVQNVHIVASCRVLEHRHDTRLRTLDAKTMELELPPWERVEAVLKKCGIEARGWNASIREDLRSPQTLNLFLQLIRTTDEADLLLGYQHMLGALWKQEVLSDPSGRSRAALYDVAERMAEREVLWLPEALFDAFHFELQRLARAGILLCEAGRVGFRHQTLYEHIRARGFLDAPGRLTDTVISRQQSLRIRPLLWHALAYMRAVDHPAYVAEITRLWHADLRPHLRMLLIEFLGQFQDPGAYETALVAEKWNDDWYRKRILATVPGSVGWFDWLATNGLAEVMRLPVDQARMALPLLRQVLPSRQSRVWELIRSNWQDAAEKDPLTWVVLEELSAWDVNHIALGRQILERTKISGWQANHMISIASATSPEQAPLLLDAWMRYEIADAQQGEEAERIAALMAGREFHDLSVVAEAAPREFTTAVWPLALRAMQHQAQDVHAILIGYRNASSNFSDFDDEDVRRETPFISAIVAAIKSLAAQHPQDFLSFLQANRHVDLMPVQRLLALGLQQIVSQVPATALEFLLEDPRRLALGSYLDVHADSNRLIRAVSPHIGAQRVQQVEQAILGWTRYAEFPEHDPKTRLLRLQWTRQHRLRLLRAIPNEYMSAPIRRLVAEEERAFPGLDDADVRYRGFTTIDSPMTATNMQQASDTDVLRLFAELPDQTQWEHPRHSLRGGIIQASQQLAELAKTRPDKAIRLVRQMKPTNNDIAVGAVLRALGESKYAASDVYALILEQNERGFDGIEFRRDAAYAAGAVATSDSPLPQILVDMLVSWLRDEAETTTDDKDEAETNDPASSILWSQGGLMILPQGNYPVLSTLTKACLSSNPPQVDTWLSILEEHLGRKEQLTVWGALAPELRWVERTDQARAERFLLRLFSVHPELCNIKTGALLLGQSQRWISEATAGALVGQLLIAKTEFAAQAAGEILTIRFALRSEDEPSVRELLERSLAGSDDDPFSTRCTIGIAHASAELWLEAGFRSAIHPYLLRLLESSNTSVVAAAARVFGQQQLTFDAYSRDLLEHLQARPGLLKQIANNDLGEYLVTMLETAPEVVSNVARSLLEVFGDEFFNQTSSRYLLAEQLLTISLRLQEMGAPHQEPGAHIFERLLEFNTAEARSFTLDLDKRTASTSGSPPPRRRRRRVRKIANK